MAELFEPCEITDKSLSQKLKMINGLTEYNRNVIEIMMDTVLEKDKLERSAEIKGRLNKLDAIRKKN